MGSNSRKRPHFLTYIMHFDLQLRRTENDRLTEVLDFDLQGIARETLAATYEQNRKAKMRYLDDRDRKCHQVFKTSEYEARKNRNPDRVEGTCQWVLNHSHYQSWNESTQDSLLWISADPGCGKSVLSKSLVDQEFKSLESCSTCYFFFKDDENQNSVSTALCALLHQLFNYQPHLLRHGIPSWDTNGEKLQKEIPELWRILLSSATDAAASNVICVLDALDECDDEGQRTLINLLTDFYNSSVKMPSRNSTLKFLVTSRPYYDIERRFRRIATGLQTVRLAGEEANKEISAEIDHVTRAWLFELSSDLDLQPGLQALLQTRLQQVQNRTYLWLYLVFEEIRKSRKRTEKLFSSIIDEIPKSVDEVYENILNKSSDRQEARILLSIIVAAERPLTLKEMDVALAIANQDSVSSYGELQLEGDNLKTVIRDLCGLFIYISDSRVYLFHQTAKEFLMKTDSSSGKVSTTVWKASLDEKDCDIIMAKACIRYLLFKEFDEASSGKGRRRKWGDYRDEFTLRHQESKKPDYEEDEEGEEGEEDEEDEEGEEDEEDEEGEDDEEDEEDEEGEDDEDDIEDEEDEDGRYEHQYYDFMDYSATYWPDHFRRADFNQRSKEFKLSLTLFNTDSPRWTAWFPIWYRNGPITYWTNNLSWTGLHFAAYCGHRKVVNHLLVPAKINVGSKDEEYGIALIWAILRGHNSVVKLLVNKGVDANVDTYSHFNTFRTPLQAAVYKGDEAIVQLLIRKGADVNMQGGYYGNALQAAVYKGHTAIVEVLLKKGADINMQGGYYENALQAAAYKDHKMIVEVLLKKGADVNIQDSGHYGNALQAAICKGYKAIVEVLLEEGADVNMQGGVYENALQAAACEGYKVIVEVLLKEGADVHMQGRFYGNALQAAACKGHKAIVEVLLKEGVDVNHQGGYYGNALQAAACLGHKATVEVLLEEGADVNMQGGFYENALQAAACEGQKAIVEGLLKKGADVNMQGGYYGNALQAAVHCRHKTIVEVLLKEGADVNIQGGYYGDALQAAAFEGYKAIVEVLLKEGAEVNMQGGYYGNALQAAASKGQEAVVQLLIENGADGLNEALQAAASKGQEGVLQLLIEKGAGDLNTALEAAASEGREAVGQLLIENGADDYTGALWKAFEVYQRVLRQNEAPAYLGNLQATWMGTYGDIMKLLIDKGADINIVGDESVNVLQAAVSGTHDTALRLLKRKCSGKPTRRKKS